MSDHERCGDAPRLTRATPPGGVNATRHLPTLSSLLKGIDFYFRVSL